MTSNKVDEFCNWWRSLTDTQLPQPSATAIEEHKHRHYFTFAYDLKSRWSLCSESFHELFTEDKRHVVEFVGQAAEELVRWFDDVAAPELDGILAQLRASDERLLQAFGDMDGPWARLSFQWLKKLRDKAYSAASTLSSTPPYVSLGAQAGRPELPLRYGTGVWTTQEVLGNWPWRNWLFVRDALAEMKDFGDDYESVMLYLISKCEQRWMEQAMAKLPESQAMVQAEVANSSWASAQMLDMVLDSEDGLMTRQALDWAKQFLAPIQPWYAGLGGRDDMLPDANGIALFEPIRAFNTAFVRPNPRVTFFSSAHVRNYCLFLRFLGDRVVSGVSFARAVVPKQKPHVQVDKIHVASVGDCVLDAYWTPRGYTIDVGTRNKPGQRTIPRLPKAVVRVLKHVRSIDLDDSERASLKPDDPHRFRKWFAGVFNVVDKSDPLPRTKGQFVKAWHTPRPKQS